MQVQFSLLPQCDSDGEDQLQSFTMKPEYKNIKKTGTLVTSYKTNGWEPQKALDLFEFIHKVNS